MSARLISQTDLDFAERALNYGDGCFTTMRYTHGELILFDAHITRLCNDASSLSINIDKQALINDLHAFLAKLNHDAVIKCCISRGVGGRGYGVTGIETCHYWFTHHPLPTDKAPLVVGIASGFLSQQPLLAGLKHMNRLEQVLFKQQAEQNGWDEILCLDSEDRLIEASSANIFMLIDNNWYTPDLSRGGVNGVMRDHLITAHGNIITTHISITDLHRAQAICLTNAVFGVMPIKEWFDGTLQHSLDTQACADLVALDPNL